MSRRRRKRKRITRANNSAVAPPSFSDCEGPGGGCCAEKAAACRCRRFLRRGCRVFCNNALRTASAAAPWRARVAMITRRNLLLSLPALAVAPRSIPRLGAQQARTPPIAVNALNHMTLTVSDVKRSVDFYQRLFGMPVQARQGATVLLRIGAGPQFIAIGGGAGNAKPGIGHFCMTTEHFNADGVMGILARHGVTKADASGGGLSGGPMKARVHIRLPDRGGAKEGTPELYLGDPDGIVIQLQDTAYCGGGGVLGNRRPVPEPAPARGVLAVRDLNHFTMSVTDGPRGAAFYQELFGLRIRAHQGVNPVLGVGAGVQFVMANRPAAGRPAAASINHACLTMSGFDPDNVLKVLTDFGLKPRGSGPAGPLMHYVSMRMPDRGGAPGGTPELYFTDPDGLVMQLQDTSYCGGGGFLGNVCTGA